MRRKVGQVLVFFVSVVRCLGGVEVLSVGSDQVILKSLGVVITGMNRDEFFASSLEFRCVTSAEIEFLVVCANLISSHLTRPLVALLFFCCAGFVFFVFVFVFVSVCVGAGP